MKTFHIVLPLLPDSKDDHLIRFGIHLAKELKAKITFLYILNAARYAGYTGSGTIMDSASLANLKEQKKIALDHYMKFLKKFKLDITANLSVEKSVV
ncbi:MAG: hypothetical protein ABFS05_02745, partial [Bacteroidota bacterium]